MRCRAAFLLVKARAVNRAHIGKEEAARRRAYTNIDIALVQFNPVLAIHGLLGTGDKGIDGLFQGMIPLAMVNEFGPLGVKLAFQLDLFFGEAILFQVTM